MPSPTTLEIIDALSRAIVLAGIPEANRSETWADELAACAIVEQNARRAHAS